MVICFAVLYTYTYGYNIFKVIIEIDENETMLQNKIALGFDRTWLLGFDLSFDKRSHVFFKHFFLSINCNNNDKENWDTQKKLLLNRSHSKEEEQRKNAKQS